MPSRPPIPDPIRTPVESLLLAGLGMPVRIGERLVGGRHGIDDEIVDLAALLGLHPIVGIELALVLGTARNLAGDLAGEVVDLELGHAIGTALSREQILPRDIDAAAERRHHAQASDDNTPHRLLRARLPRR